MIGRSRICFLLASLSAKLTFLLIVSAAELGFRGAIYYIYWFKESVRLVNFYWKAVGDRFQIFTGIGFKPIVRYIIYFSYSFKFASLSYKIASYSYIFLLGELDLRSLVKLILCCRTCLKSLANLLSRFEVCQLILSF